MRISDLVRGADVGTATIKYYLREGLLPPGRPTSPTTSEYEEHHLARLKLIRALVEVGGLSLAAVRQVLAAIDAGPTAIPEAVGAAHTALGPVPTRRPGPNKGRRAVELLTELGWRFDPRAPAVRQLDAALTALDDVGMPPAPERLRTYAQAALTVATADVGDVPTDSGTDAVAFVVLGTVLYEPVLLALRRLAQAHVYTGGTGDGGTGLS
jgi:DNA-binding transcriptional MerR regulator